MLRHAIDDNRDRRTIDQNINALSMIVRQRVDDGWHPHLCTLMFARIPFGPTAVIGRMGDAADRLYRTFVTNVVRRPTSPASLGSLPILIGAPDKPVAKRSKPTAIAPVLNDGLHMHALLLVPPHSRLTTTADAHFRDHQRLYSRWPLDRVDVRSIDHTPERALAYVLKSIRRRRLSFDHVLILPRALAELR